MNAIIYCRVSTKEQVREGLSLENQEKACNQFAEAKGYQVVKAFIEQGESAKTSERTQLLALLSYCAKNKGRVDYLIVWKVDRFARQTSDHFALRAKLILYGVKLISVTEPIDDSPIGKFVETVLAGSAQFDNEIKTERVVGGMKGRTKQGKWVFGRVPLGYTTETDENGNGKMVKDLERSEIIGKAFIEYSTGIYSQAEIIKMVTREGLKTRRGLEVSPQTLHNILQNPVYAGYMPNPWEGKPEEGDFHEPIVSKEIFRTCQAVRNGFKPSQVVRQKHNPEFPLRGLLRCEKCTRPLTGSKSQGNTKKYGYYHCYRCTGVSYRSDKLNEKFRELLTKIKPKASYVKDFKEICLDVWKEEYKTVNILRRRLNRELLDLEDKKEKIIDLGAYKRISSDDLQKRLEKLKTEILEKELALNGLREKEYDTESLLNYAEWFLTRTDKVWIDLEPEVQKKFQQFIFPEGLHYDRNGFSRTPKLSSIYAVFQASDEKKSSLVAPTGIEPVLQE